MKNVIYRFMGIKHGIVSHIAWYLPRRIVYWCGIRIWAHATSGKWRDTDPTEVCMADALRRWMEPAGRGSEVFQH